MPAFLLARLRFAIFCGSSTLTGLGFVVMDEVHYGPDVTIAHVAKSGRDHQEDKDGEARLMPALEVGLGRPQQEGSDVLGHLVDRWRWVPLGIGHLTVRGDRRRHGDVEVGEIGVVVQPFRRRRGGELRQQLRRWVLIAGQQRIDIGGAAFPGLGHQREVGRKRVVVRRARCSLIGVRRREAVRGNGLAGCSFAGIRVDARNLDCPLVGDRLHLGFAIAELVKVAEGDQAEPAHTSL